MRHLTPYDIESALRRGRSVEQLISPSKMKDATILRWLELRITNDDYTLTLHEVFDDGSEEYLDVYSFEEVAPADDPVHHAFPTLHEALAFGEASYAAPRERYVHEAVIQDEYADYLRGRRSA